MVSYLLFRFAANVKDLRGFLVTFPYFSGAIDYKGIS